MDNFDPYNVLLSIAANIPVLLMTAFVLQGHIYCWTCVHVFICVSVGLSAFISLGDALGVKERREGNEENTDKHFMSLSASKQTQNQSNTTQSLVHKVLLYIWENKSNWEDNLDVIFLRREWHDSKRINLTKHFIFHPKSHFIVQSSDPWWAAPLRPRLMNGAALS